MRNKFFTEELIRFEKIVPAHSERCPHESLQAERKDGYLNEELYNYRKWQRI